MRKNINIDNYEFAESPETDDELVLLIPQRLRKCELAFFYDLTPSQFRRNISTIITPVPDRHHYSVEEVRQILTRYGSVSRADVCRAIPRIRDYYQRQHKRDMIRYAKKH